MCGGERAVIVNTGLRGLVPCTGSPLNCRTPPLLGANGHTTLYSTYVHGHASCAPARLRSQSPLLRLSGRALGSSRSLARLPGVTRLPLQSFLMPLPRLWPRLRFAFDWYRSLRGRRRPGRGLPGRGRRHWVVSPPLPGRTGPLSLVDESRPHPRPLYRPRLAPPLRRLLSRLGGAWPSLSKIAVVRLPLRLAFPR